MSETMYGVLEEKQEKTTKSGARFVSTKISGEYVNFFGATVAMTNGLRVGSRVKLEYEPNGKFKNPVSIEQHVEEPTKQSTTGAHIDEGYEAKHDGIVRSTAYKGAIEIVCALIKAGKLDVSPADAIIQALKLSDAPFNYIKVGNPEGIAPISRSEIKKLYSKYGNESLHHVIKNKFGLDSVKKLSQEQVDELNEFFDTGEFFAEGDPFEDD